MKSVMLKSLHLCGIDVHLRVQNYEPGISYGLKKESGEISRKLQIYNFVLGKQSFCHTEFKNGFETCY